MKQLINPILMTIFLVALSNGLEAQKTYSNREWVETSP